MPTQHLAVGPLGNGSRQIKVPIRFNIPEFIENDDGNRI